MRTVGYHSYNKEILDKIKELREASRDASVSKEDKLTISDQLAKLSSSIRPYSAIAQEIREQGYSLAGLINKIDCRQSPAIIEVLSEIGAPSFYQMNNKVLDFLVKNEASSGGRNFLFVLIEDGLVYDCVIWKELE